MFACLRCHGTGRGSCSECNGCGKSERKHDVVAVVVAPLLTPQSQIGFKHHCYERDAVWDEIRTTGRVAVQNEEGRIVTVVDLHGCRVQLMDWTPQLEARVGGGRIVPAMTTT